MAHYKPPVESRQRIVHEGDRKGRPLRVQVASRGLSIWFLARSTQCRQVSGRRIDEVDGERAYSLLAGIAEPLRLRRVSFTMAGSQPIPADLLTIFESKLKVHATLR